MARRRKGRAIDGIFLLDKSVGGSSNHALQRVKRIFKAQKAGHTGALDPLASGMLPICLGEATKFSQFLLDADKTYLVTAKLGVRTTTSDADGDVVETKPVNVSEQQVVDTVAQFRGPSKQVPSMFSALKHQGKPLYVYARQGIVVPREPRDITIFALDILRIEGDEIDMRVHCSKGTYIRSLVDDIGQRLACGAYVTRLHRTQVADYPSDNMMSLEKLQTLVDSCSNDDGDCDYQKLDALLLPMDTAVKSLTRRVTDETECRAFLHGQAIAPDCAVDVTCGQRIRVYSPRDEFIGVGYINELGEITPKRVVVIHQDTI